MKSNKLSYKKFIAFFYTFRFFTDFAFIYAVYIIFFKIRGLSVLEISLLLTLWCGFVVIMEVPTGALADRWNRKHLLSLGLVSKAVGFMVWFFADSFWLFALGFLFWGIQETFHSGTQEALLFENLKKFNRQQEYDKISGNGHFFSKIATGVSVFLGGIIASFSFKLVILLSALSMMTALLATFFLEEVESHRLTGEKIRYFSQIKIAFGECLTNANLLRLIVYSAIVLGIIGILDEFEQLYFDWLGLPITFFGMVSAARMLLAAAGNKLAHRFRQWLGEFKAIYYPALGAGILLMLAVSDKSLFMLPVFAVVFFFGGVGEVLVESGLQNSISSNKRATIISINALILGISAGIFSLLFGIISKIGSLAWGFLFFALMLFVFSIFSIFFKKNPLNE